MILSFVLYFVVFLVSCLACQRYEFVVDNYSCRQKKGWLSFSVFSFQQLDKWLSIILILVPPIFIYTFRAMEVGTDTFNYFQMYEYNKYLNLSRYIELYGSYKHSHEYGFHLILRLSYLLNGGYNLVKFICGFMIVFFAWRGFYYFHTKFKVSSGLCMFFFYLMEFSYGFNGTRFAIALSLFLFSFRFIIEKKMLHYAICCFLMTLFHSSMIIAFLFYFINFSGYSFLKENWKYVAMISIIVLVVFLRPIVDSLLPYISQYFVRFEGYEVDTASSYGFGILFIFVLFLIPLVRWDKYVANNINWTCILMVSLSFIIFRLCGYYCPWLIRLSRMPEILFCVLYSGTSCLAVSKGERYLWKAYSILLVVVYYILTIVVQRSSEVYPYVFDFSNRV